MGAMRAMGLAEAVIDGMIDLRQALDYHLTVNHFPPVPSSMIEPCIEAIDAIRDDDPGRLIDLPDQVTYRGETQAPAWAIVDAHHLDYFI